jgi:hypothetical protein
MVCNQPEKASSDVNARCKDGSATVMFSFYETDHSLHSQARRNSEIAEGCN